MKLIRKFSIVIIKRSLGILLLFFDTSPICNIIKEKLIKSIINTSTIPVTIFAFIFEGIGASFIPACARTKGKQEENLLTNNLINILLLLTIAFIIIVEIFPTVFITLFASGLDNNSITMANMFLRIGIIGVIFSSLVYVFIYYLNNNDSFIIPVLRSIPMDIIVVLSIALSYKFNNLYILAFGIPISLLFELFFLFPNLKRKGYKYNFYINFKDDNLIKIIKWSIPIIITTAIADLNTIIDRQFSSWIMVGGISYLSYSSRTINAFRTALFIPVITVLFPNFSKKVTQDKIDEVSNTATNSLSILTIISIPLTVMLMYFSKDIITLIFQRGAFDTNSTMITSICLKYYAIGLFGYAVLAITSKLYHSLTNTKTPMYISLLGLTINIILNALLYKRVGISGLAISTSVSTIIMAILQYILLIKKIKLDYKKNLTCLFKTIISSLVMLGIIILLNNLLVGKCAFIIKDGIIALTGIILYLAMLIVFKTKEINYFLRMR